MTDIYCAADQICITILKSQTSLTVIPNSPTTRCVACAGEGADQDSIKRFEGRTGIIVELDDVLERIKAIRLYGIRPIQSGITKADRKGSIRYTLINNGITKFILPKDKMIFLVLLCSDDGL